MHRKRRSFLGIMACGAAAIATGAHAQAFPNRFVKLVVPFAPGGATDVLGRILAKAMGESLHQSVVVENHPGAGGTIGTEYVTRQPADGYTFLLINAIPHTASKSLYPGISYDPVKSFTPIGALGTVRYMLIVSSDSPARNLAQFIDMARAQPDKLNFGSAGVGSAPHLAMELFERAANIRMEHVPYTGSGPAITDLIGGRIQAIMENTPAVPLIKAGRLRALAVTGTTRTTTFPDVPTFAEAGLANFDVTGSWGLVGAAGLPPAAVTALNGALEAALKDPTVRNTLAAQGIDPAYGSADAYGATLVSELDKWTRLIHEANIKL